MEYMESKMQDQIEGTMSANEELCNEIESLRNQLVSANAELVRKQDRDSQYSNVCCKLSATENEVAQLRQLRQQLAAAQLQMKQYRDGFDHIQEYWNGDANESAMFDALTHIKNVAHTALSVPSDTTALSAMIAKADHLSAKDYIEGRL